MPAPIDLDWQAIKLEYESDPTLTHYQLCKKYGVAKGTIARRAQLDAWKKEGDVRGRITRAAQRINDSAEQAIINTCAEVQKQVAADTAQTLRDLAPWIERMRADHIKYIVSLSRKALGRVNNIFETTPPKAPKDESFAAQAIDKHDAIIRRNLGMGDSSPTNSLNVQVLVSGGRSVHDQPNVTLQNQAQIPES